MSDRELQEAVTRALASDVRLSSQPIDVSVSGGQVILRGRVQSHRRKLAAHETAAALAGAAGVDNRLEVEVPGNPSDEEVAEEVRELLERERGLVKESILVSVRAGRITLSGTVATDAERTLAEDVALRAAGAERVVNQLVVETGARSEALAVGRELQHLFATTPELTDSDLRIAISGDVAVLSGTAASPGQVEIARSLVRQAWTGELRDETLVEGS